MPAGVLLAVLAAVAAFFATQRKSSPLLTHSNTAGYADAFDVLAVDASERPSPDPVNRLTLGPRTGLVPLADLLSMRNVVFFAIDIPNRLFVFVEVDDLAAVWAEPFLDRAIPKHVGRHAWAVALDDIESWTSIQKTPKAMWVWNTGRCGSTLVHRIVSTVDVASVSESCWMDQLAKERRKMPDEQLVRFLKASYALDVHVASRLFPHATMYSMNPKGYGYRILDLVEQTFPTHKMMYLYRAADEVVQSFYKLLLPGLPSVLQTALKIDFLQPLVKKALQATTGIDSFMSQELKQVEAEHGSLGISNAMAQQIAGFIFDGLAYWIETANDKRDSFVLRFKELSAKDSDLQRRVVQRLLKWIFDQDPSDLQISTAMDSFSKDSQEGSAMSKAKLVGVSQQAGLAPETIDQIKAAARKVPSAGRSDFVAPGTLFVE